VTVTAFPGPDIATLPAALENAARLGRGELVFHPDGDDHHVASADLLERARTRAHTLASHGVQRGDRVGLFGGNSPQWAEWAYGAWMAGACLVPIGLPLRIVDAAGFAQRLAGFAKTARCRVIVHDPALAHVVPHGSGIPWDAAPAPAGALPVPGPEDLAVVQFTSGSTSAPKGVMLTHRAILAEARARTGGLSMTDDDVMVSWLPFFHDLGLFMFLLYASAFGLEAHLMPTERFARDPVEWLRLADRVRATFTFGPPSGWAALARALQRRPVSLDLSCMTFAGTGAEPLYAHDMDRVQSATADCALAPASFGAGYGLAEAVLGVTTTVRGTGVRFEAVDLDALAQRGEARTAADARNAKLVATCGVPWDGVRLRIDGARGECGVGEVLVHSPSLMNGYDPQHAADPFVGGWLRTGDLGFLSGGELFITGRLKDMMIVLGHNYYPEDFEWGAAQVPGVRPGRCVAFARPGADAKVVVLVEPSPEADTRELRRAVLAAVTRVVGIRPAEVIVVPRGTIEKTTSGKLRRGAMKEAYARGEIPAL